MHFLKTFVLESRKGDFELSFPDVQLEVDFEVSLNRGAEQRVEIRKVILPSSDLSLLLGPSLTSRFVSKRCEIMRENKKKKKVKKKKKTRRVKLSLCFYYIIFG